MRARLRQTDWTDITTGNPEQSCQNLTTKILDCMQEFIPSRNLATRPCDPKWWTLACTRAVEAKDKAWNCWLRNKWDPGLKQNFLVAVNLTVKVIAKAKSAMEARIRSKLATGSLRDKEWWCTMKRASGSNKESSVPLLIDSSGKECHSSQEKSECLAQ